jgi:hypothetical protein
VVRKQIIVTNVLKLVGLYLKVLIVKSGNMAKHTMVTKELQLMARGV